MSKPWSTPQRRFQLLIFLQITILCLLGVFVLRTKKGGNISYRESVHQSEGLYRCDSYKECRQLGLKFQSAGLFSLGMKYFDQALRLGHDNDQQDASLILSMAHIFYSEGDLESALGAYYVLRQRFSSFEQDKDLVSRRIVEILERLGKSQSAKQFLQDELTLNPVKSDKRQVDDSELIVATINNVPIYISELNEAYDHLPKNIRDKHFAQKSLFLQKHVSDRLLYEKAKRLDYLKRADVQKTLAAFRQRLVVDMMIDKELMANIRKNIRDLDVKNYYEANKGKYDPQISTADSFELVKERVRKDYQEHILQHDYAKLVKDLQKSEQVQLFPERL